MVRVMSIYHFASQTIQQLTIEELTAACLIESDYIVLARNSDHTIEIRKLNSGLNESAEVDDAAAVKQFSSVDDVKQLFYSRFGNFLISVESRLSNYEKTEISYVRVYVNWDSIVSGQVQALRARIAGKITPMKKSLEMIELPLNYNPSVVSFCESTGNIIVAHENILQIFYFKYCTNETTKLQYVDFFESPFVIELDFEPTKVLLNENVICCCNKQFMHVFKIIDRQAMESNSTTISESNVCTSTEVPEMKEPSNVNLEYDVDYQAICNRKELNGNAFRVDITSTQEEIISFDESEMKPLVVNEMGIQIKYVSTVTSTIYARNLLQLKLQSMKISGVLRENVDIFKSIHMKPLYIKSKLCDSNDDFFLHSKFHSHFYGCAILITTQQDGYLYQVKTNTLHEDASKCFLNVYPFTSSVIDVYFNFNVIHALCENGIESYTHRIGQKIFEDLSGKFNLPEMDTIYRNLSNTISLVNLRPFMNVHFMIPSNNNLVLLANDSPASPNESGSEYEAVNWTIYNLKYPSIDTINQDYKEFADKSLRRYPSYYMNLIEEMHIMIRTHIFLGQLQVSEENSEFGSEMRLVWNECDDLLRETSLALADCLILNPCEYKLSLLFYEMAHLNIIGIFQRFIDQNGLVVSIFYFFHFFFL
jgi:hypothetical protein